MERLHRRAIFVRLCAPRCVSRSTPTRSAHFAVLPRIRMSHLGNTFKKCDPYRILSVASLTAPH